MKAKATKKLVASLVAIVLSFATLVGTTFAWFTDSTSSNGNIIASGNLDVNAYWMEAVKDPNNAENWIQFNGEPIFNYSNWEPGYVEAKHLKVTNEGSLAFKYSIVIQPNGPVSELADVISVYYFANATKLNAREEIENGVMVGTLADLIADPDGATHGILLPLGEQAIKENEKVGESSITIALKMEEEIGDEYQGLSIGTDFDIVVYAAQYDYENDSFGNDFDNDVPYGTYIEINEGENLLTELASAEANKPVTIKLNCDVEWVTDAHHNENDITLASSIVIDGNGHTITATGSGVTPLGDNDAPMTLKNVRIVDESVSYAENSWEFTYLELGGSKLTCENVIFADEIQTGTNATFTNCSFESNEENVYAVWVESGSATFENCKVTGYRGVKMHEEYGTEISSVIVNNCTFNSISKKPGIAIGDLNADTTISITGCTFADTQAGDQGMYSYETDTDVATFNFIYTGNVVAKYAESTSDLNNAIKNGENVVLGGGEYTLPTLNGKDGLTIQGSDDGSTVIGGENASTGFGGNFGKNTTIKNVTFAGSTNGVRYSYAQGGISIFENCTFAGDSTYGFHIDQSNGATFIFNDCTFSGFNAFAGDLEKVIFNNCTFLFNGKYGHTNIWSTAEFNNCKFGDKASVSPSGNNAHLYFNGVEESYHHEFVGSAESLFTFAKSVNEGGDAWMNQKVLLIADIDLENKAWTPIGQTGATEFKGIFDGQNYTIKNLNVDNSDKTDEHTSSGLFGWAESNVTIMNVKIDGATVKGNHNVAVIVGYTYSGKISNCHVTNAEIICTHANNDACGDKCGLIVGYAGDESRITDCSASDSSVKAGRDAGQLVGCGYNVSVSNCVATNVTVENIEGCTGANINETIIGRVIK